MLQQAAEYSGEQSLEVTDSILITQARAGNQRAFETLVQRYQVMLFKYIIRMIGDYDQARDVLQQVFLQMHHSMPILRSAGPIRPWLMRVAHNRCIDELRKKRPLYFSQLDIDDDDDGNTSEEWLVDHHSTPEEVVEQHELRGMIQRAICSLPPKFRLVVSLRYGQHLSFSEIGQILDMRETTAKVYFYRSQPLLRAALSAYL